MPLLEAPAGYICVIRDIDSDTYRIDATGHPAALVRAILNAKERRFGIELVSILEADDLCASESALYECHHARLSQAWHTLDAYQLEELRQSILQIDAHVSFYLTPERKGSAAALPSTTPIWRSSSRASTRSRRGDSLSPPFDLGQYLRDRIVTLIVNHPFKVIYAVALLLVLVLALGLIYGYNVTHSVSGP